MANVTASLTTNAATFQVLGGPVDYAHHDNHRNGGNHEGRRRQQEHD
jgi:hypothetical protein